MTEATKPVAEQILAAEQQRCSAMVSADLDALNHILDNRIMFCHATGSVDNKDAYLGKMAEGRILYRAIEWSQQVVTDLGSSAILSGKMITQVCVGGTEKTLNNRVIEVWTSETDKMQPWKLVAFQSTPIIQK